MMQRRALGSCTLTMWLRPSTTIKVCSSIKGTSDAATAALIQVKDALAMKEDVPGEIASDLKDILKAGSFTMETSQKAVTGVEQIAAQNANLGYELNRSLEQMTALSCSLRSLSDYLDHHPEALITGKHPL
jgi:paraquat-inducible protein B